MKRNKIKKIYKTISTPEERIIDMLENGDDVPVDKDKLLKLYKQISTPEEKILDFIENIDSFKGKDGKTPKKGEDYLTQDEIDELLKIITPQKGKDYFDGETPSEEKLISLIKPLIPEPQKGKDGNIITTDEIIEKLKNKLSIFDLKDLEWLNSKKDNIQWSSAGFKVYTDSTLTGDGSFANPLSVVGGGFTILSAIGTVDGSNQTFTFTQVPTFIVVDGAWYQKTDNNGVVQWSNVGLTISTTITPSNSIFGVL